MALSPQEIVRKEFREAFRGYNQADVDLFLDEVVEEFARLSEENQKMKVRLAALQQEVARLREGRAAPLTPQGATGQPDPQRVDAEVRARMRRLLEEQLRALETASPATSSTVERIARELPRSPEAAETSRRVARPAPPASSAPDEPKRESREPFWAGE